MSFVLPDATSIPQPEGITRYTLFKRLATATGLLQTGQVTSGDVYYIEDTERLLSKQYSSQDWEGGWLRISQTTDNEAPEGEISPIDRYEPELGRVSVSPAITAPEAGDQYELWRVDPNIVIRLVDELLTEELTIPHWSVLSEIPDFDMEQSGTEYWSSSNADIEKETSFPKLTTSGKRHLKVTSTSANGYAESTTMNVEPHQTFWVSAVGRAAESDTTIKLVLWDKTNDKELDSVSSKRQHPVRMGKWMRVGKDTYQISIRLQVEESGKETHWGEVVFQPNYSNAISAPWWVDHHEHVLGVFRLIPLGSGQYIYDPTLHGEQDTRFDTIPNRLGTPKYIIKARAGTLETPLYIYGLRHETAYADDNQDEKHINNEYFLSGVKYKIYEYLTQPLVSGIVQNVDAASKLELELRQFRMLKTMHNPAVRNVITSPTPTASFIDERFTFGAR